MAAGSAPAPALQTVQLFPEDTSGLEQKQQVRRGSNGGDKCCTAAIAITALVLVALTVLAVLARQGCMPSSCNFGGHGGSTTVAVASGVLAVLFIALALCPRSKNGDKSPNRHSPRSEGSAAATMGSPAAGGLGLTQPPALTTVAQPPARPASESVVSVQGRDSDARRVSALDPALAQTP